jgi:CRP-like cAMP-binding protein
MKSFIQQFGSTEWQELITHHEERKIFRKGQIIFHAGEQTKGLYIVTKGKVKITYRQYDGTERLIRLARDGDVVGHRGFGGNWKYPISAQAMGDTQISFVPLNVFKIVAKTNPEFAYNFMIFFAEELRKSEAEIMKYPVKNLVARALLENYKVFGFEKADSTKLSFTLSRKDLASKAGTTYETVVRVLAELSKNNIILAEGKSIHILNMDELMALSLPKHKKTK